MNYLLLLPILITAGAMLLDYCFGEPKLLCHPVILIGKLISFTEHCLLYPGERKKTAKNEKFQMPEKRSPLYERVSGIIFAIFVCACSTLVAGFIIFHIYHWNMIAGIAVDIFFCFRLLAARSLKTESMRVYDALKKGSLDESRYALSMIVGRDTQNLDRKGIIKAVVETIAENTSDGVTAPLFYMIFAGAVGGFFYKSVNTMDSMVGYKNDKYRYFGTMAAKTDDLLNYLPARLSAMAMIIASGICGCSMKNAWKTFRRDRYQHASPNSAQTESVMAGALGVQLAGPASYFGEIHEKPFIGDAHREINAEDIVLANRIMMVTALVSEVLLAILKIGIVLLAAFIQRCFG